MDDYYSVIYIYLVDFSCSLKCIEKIYYSYFGSRSLFIFKFTGDK